MTKKPKKDNPLHADRHQTQRLPMDVRGFYCPNCKSKDLMFAGTQKGYGYAPNMDLWTCRLCLGTFSMRSLGIKGKSKG